MAFKLVLISAILAAANAGIVSPLGYGAVGYGAPLGYASPLHQTAIGSQTQSVVRSADGNSAISTYSKAVDTAYSSVRKYDTRVSNDAIVKVASPVAYAAAPAYASYASPALGYASPALGYASPLAARVAAPLGVASYGSVAHGIAAPVGYASPLGYAASPALGYAGARVAAPLGVAAHGGLLGVAYSAAPAVAHISYSTPTLSYAY